jgi:D-alanyl-D-alanine carboxypeptidase
MMTAYVVFPALNEKRIALTDTGHRFAASAFAAPGKLGSRMYSTRQRGQ